MLCLTHDHFALARCGDIAPELHEASGSEDRRERISELVREERHEFVLPAIRLAQGGLRLLEPRDVDERSYRTSRRSARITERNCTSVKMHRLSVVEAHDFLPASHFHPSGGALQREVLVLHLHIVHEHFEMPGGLRVRGGLRYVSTGAGPQELVTGAISRHHAAIG